MNTQRLFEILGDVKHFDIDAFAETELAAYFTTMARTQQNPQWHGEGDVLTHTLLVCNELIKSKDYIKLGDLQRQELLLAALLHDIGKVRTTRQENGVLVSYGHSAVGARIARDLLWREFSMCGEPGLIRFRETVCSLVLHHSFPAYALETKEPVRRLASISSQGELAKDFNMEMLCLLSEADIKGRKAENTSEKLESVSLCMELAKENQCLTQPMGFTDDFSEFAYISGRNILPGQKLYDESRGETILMSGLPGTGKDTWLKSNGIEAVVSLDDIRKKLNISPRDKQGAVIDEAKRQAKEYLRKKQPFAWNATNITELRRAGLVRLFSEYHAKTRIVYLETSLNEQLIRNANRPEVVPEGEIFRMLSILELPQRHEAHSVEWHCV